MDDFFVLSIEVSFFGRKAGLQTCTSLVHVCKKVLQVIYVPVRSGQAHRPWLGRGPRAEPSMSHQYTYSEWHVEKYMPPSVDPEGCRCRCLLLCHLSL